MSIGTWYLHLLNYKGLGLGDETKKELMGHAGVGGCRVEDCTDLSSVPFPLVRSTK